MPSWRTLLPIVAFAWCSAIAAYGQNPAQTIVLPPVELTPNETAQINVVSSARNYPGWTFWDTCQVSVTFYGAGGSAVGTPVTFTVGKGAEITSVQMPYASTGAKGSVAPVTARIALTPDAASGSTLSPPIPPCTVAFSLQTFDTATGATHAFVSGQAALASQPQAIVGGVTGFPCPYPDDSCDSVYQRMPNQVIVLPPVSLATTETAQVDLASSAAGYSTSPEACNASVTFYGADGVALGTPTVFALGKAPEVFSAQLPYASTGGKISSTAVSAQIAFTALPITVPYGGSAIPPCAIAFSMKTFDAATGVTHAFVAGQSTQAETNLPVVGAPAEPPRQRRRPQGPVR